MVEEKVTLTKELGLHARPASKFVREAIKFKSDISIIKGDKTYNGKSIMSVLSMGASQGDELTIVASGEDETEAIKRLLEVINMDLA